MSAVMVMIAPVLPEPCCCASSLAESTSGIECNSSIGNHPGPNNRTASCCATKLASCGAGKSASFGKAKLSHSRSIKTCCAGESGERPAGRQLGSLCQSCEGSTQCCIEDQTNLALPVPEVQFAGGFEPPIVVAVLDIPRSLIAYPLSFFRSDVSRGRDLCVRCCRWLI